MSVRYLTVLFMLFMLSSFSSQAEVEPEPKADETGMVPGDVILCGTNGEATAAAGSSDAIPGSSVGGSDGAGAAILVKKLAGHAAIYVGKWQNLPEGLRQKYADVFADPHFYSNDPGLKDSFLVVDSMPSMHVRLRSLAEQMTGFFTGFPRALRPKGALYFSQKSGGAVAHPKLAVNDTKRWRIVEEALKACVAKVKNDDTHAQLATTNFGTSDYSKMQVDCISLCHVVYYKAADIDLDKSWSIYQTPMQLHAFAKDQNLFRAVVLEPVYAEAVLSGRWQGESSHEFKGTIEKKPMVIELEPHPKGFKLFILNPQTLERIEMDKTERVLAYTRDQNDMLALKYENVEGGDLITLQTTGADTAEFKMENLKFKKTKPWTATIKKVRRQPVKVAE